jgi:hypothetical protein
MRNAADVAGGKPIAVWSQSISAVNAINSLVAFYDIHGRKWEMPFFYPASDNYNLLLIITFYELLCSRTIWILIRFLRIKFIELTHSTKLFQLHKYISRSYYKFILFTICESLNSDSICTFLKFYVWQWQILTLLEYDSEQRYLMDGPR